MDSQFEILKTIGSGSQGTVLLVKDRKHSNILRALKKIECKDETEASLSFKEAEVLKTLSHPSICCYHDLYVSWDGEDCAMYMCLVMDYYKDGDLETTLKEYRTKQVEVDHALIMKWVGQMIDALNYVHRNEMIHRSLKPTNIMVSSNQDLIVGDFGVPSLIESAKSVSTRRPVGAISWMAPEVLEGTRCDESADIYSLGCIILELASCGFLDYNEIHRVMFESKQDRLLLDNALEKIEEIYTGELAEVIRKCMRRAYKQRPTTAQLCKIPYVQKCFKLCQSQLYMEMDSDANSSISEGAELPVPSTGGMEALFNYLRINSSNLACQLLGLRQLIKQEDLSSMSTPGKLQLLHIINSYKESVEVQQLSCQALAIHAATAELLKKDVIFSEKFIESMLSVMRMHCEDKAILDNGTAFLMAISVDDVAAGIIGALGGIQDVLFAMRKYPEDLEIVSNSVTAIWSLSLVESNMKLLTELEAMKDIYQVLQQHMGTRDLVNATCSMLCALALVDENAVLLAKLGGIDLLLKVITTFSKDVEIVRFSCSTLRSLAEVQEVYAHHIMQTKAGINGFSVLKTTAELLSSENQVIESVVSLIQSLAYYDTLREELLSLDVVPFLTKLNLAFSSSDVRVSSVATAISQALASVVREAEK